MNKDYRYFGPNADPAARAKRELGELLVERYVTEHHNDPKYWAESERFTCSINLGYRSIVRHGATPDAALVSALDAARKAER